MKEWPQRGAIVRVIREAGRESLAGGWVRVSKEVASSETGFEPEWIEPHGTTDTSYCDVIGDGDEWVIVPDDEVPDWVWATIAKRRLTE